MIESIIRFSVKNKLIIGLLVLVLIGGGIYSLRQLPIDAVPDITSNQVQIVTVSQSLAPQEVEQFITYPVEVAMANIPNVIKIRSISRFGLSVVTVVFEGQVPMLDARQFVKEQISMAEQEIPAGLGKPEMMPITTGLGEIYQYVLQVEPGYEHEYDAMRLRTIQDWIVKRQLAGIEGIIEISSFGGYLKQYEIALDPVQLQSYDVAIEDVFEALARNNQNSGGSYIERGPNAFYIRTEGVVDNMEDIGNIVVTVRNNIPVLVKDVGKIHLGHPKRFGAMTMDGKGETVGGITLMLKGANSSQAIQNVHQRVEEVRKSLPEGVRLYAYLDRSDLVADTTHTIETNLLEGGLIVVVVLFLMLGNLRAGLIVASIIPLAMLFALILMNQVGVSANLMSLGAIDFGIVVDGAVIVVEGLLAALVGQHLGERLSQERMDEVIIGASSRLFQSAVFGVFIILVVFIPIMTLTGVEGKMFRPMALTFSFVVLGALILSLTYVPMMSALILPNKIKDDENFSDKFINFLKSLYRPTLNYALRMPYMVLGLALTVLVGAYLLFRTLGAEFIPTLEEGDLAMQMTIQPGSSLDESIRTSTKAERILLDNFPEIRHVVSKIGTAEVPTDPMAVEEADIMIILDEKDGWTSAGTREGLVELMKEELSVIAGASFEFTQPIQLRFNELMTGVKTDIAVKIFGENTDTLKALADRAAAMITDIPGAGDVRVEQTEGLPQLVVDFDRRKIAEYGLSIEKLNTLVRTAYAGERAGVVFENERKFDLVLRLEDQYRNELDLDRLFVHLNDERVIPLGEVATAHYTEGPMQISREDTRRRINIGINVRNRDIASLVADIQQMLADDLNLPAGYSINYGGDFENLEKAQRRLAIAVPTALGLIFILLYFTFGKLKYALLIFTAVPMAAIGGVIALWIRDMPFSISAGVGFIALFGVAVLNGIVLISHFNQLRYEEGIEDLKKLIIEGGSHRLRPVLMTATVAAMGFLPMALSTSNGAEVQKPLATVVIGGLVTATLLTLVLLPTLYYLVNRITDSSKGNRNGGLVALLLLFGLPLWGQSQEPVLQVDSAVQHALQAHPVLQNAALQIQVAELGIDQARRTPPAELQVQFGQINTSLVDYNASVVQSLGNLAVKRQGKELARANVLLNQHERTLLNRQITYQVRRAWYEWVATGQRVSLLQEQLNLYAEVYQRARLQQQTGAISALERTLTENQQTRVQRALSEARVQEQQAYRNLLRQAYLSGNFSAPADAPPPLPAPSFVETVDTALIAPAAQRVAVAREETVLADKQTAPELSLGYFNQSIRPDYAFQGGVVGLSLPIFTRSQRAQVEQRRLQEVIAANQLQWQERQLEQRREQATQEVALLQQLLEEQGAALQDQAASLRRLAQLQLEAGEVDYFRYVQSLDAALQSELDYLVLIRQYNTAVLDYNFLTE